MSLRYSIIRRLAKLLNPESNITADWRLLADKLGFTNEDILNFGREKSPTEEIINSYKGKSGKSQIETLQDIMKYARMIEREDVYSLIEEWKEQEEIQQTAEYQPGHQRMLCAQRIRPRNLEFKGREQLLQNIRLEITSGLSAVTQRLTIYGLGGIGKTELATEFAHRNKHFYNLIRWIDADTTSLLPAFREFAEDLGIEIHGQNIDSIVRQVFRKLRTIKSWLLIYDNAPDYGFIKKYLPKLDALSEMQHILVTSRSPKWNRTILLDVFMPAEAVEFIKSQCNSDNDTNCRELVETLGYLPLALRQAAQYINQHRKTTQQYLQLYNENQLKLLAWNFDFEAESEKTVMTTWVTSEEKISETSVDAENLLHWCAFLSPDNIPVKLFKHASLLSSEIRVDEAIDVAQNYSMVTLLSEDHEQCMQIHRLVQLVIRRSTIKNKDKSCIIKKYLDTLVKSLTDAFPTDLFTLDDFRTARMYFPHIKSLLLNIKDYIPRMSSLVEDLMDKTMSAMIAAMESNDALMIGEQLVKLLEERYGSDSLRVADAQQNMGMAMQDLGDVRGAVSIYQKVILIEKMHCGVDSVQVCLTQEKMANAMSILGDVHGGVRIYKKIIPIYERHYGEDSIEVCRAQENMALSLNDIGDHHAALNIYRRIIPVQQNQFGEKNVNTAYTHINMTYALNDIGDNDAVIPILEKVSPILQAQIGDNNMYLAEIHENMAEAVRQNGKPIEALKLFETSITMKENQAGDNHVEIARTLYKMSFCLIDLDKVQKAQAILERAYEICVDNKCKENYPVMERIMKKRQQLRSNNNYDKTPSKACLGQKQFLTLISIVLVVIVIVANMFSQSILS